MTGTRHQSSPEALGRLYDRLGAVHDFAEAYEGFHDVRREVSVRLGVPSEILIAAR